MSDSTAGLAPPGSSSYNSATMSVGDGTWDAKTNTFLLPNLQGLNFATMQYNGMGNRFSTMQGYHSLIRAHGVIAAIVFLFIVPFAIMFNRFYGREPWFALKVHIWCQIVTLLLTTVVFILGNIAVGPSRALTNPHHGIGLAIYVLIIFQFLSGWLTHRGEKNRKKSYRPVKAVVHMWFGRLTALLGLAQVPLGLTLYGSPAYLFVLYSLVTAALIVTYFVLSYIQDRNRGLDYESELSQEEEENRRSGRFGRYATAAAAGVGISALTNRLRHRREAASRHSGSSVSDEKFSQYGHRQETQQGFSKKSILGIGTLATLGYWIGGKFGKRKNKKERDDMTEYSGTVSDSFEAAEEGRHGASPGPSPAAHHALNPGSAGHRRQDSEMSESTWERDDSPTRRGTGHGLRDAAIGIGTFAFARNYFKKRKERKEDERLEQLRQQELEDERIQRANSRKYTGDGVPRLNAPSVVSTNPGPIAGAVTAAGALAGPPPIRHVPDTGPMEDPFVSAVPAPPPPPHSVGMSSRSYDSLGTQRPLHQGHGDALAAGAAGAAVGMAAATAMDHRNRSSSRRRESGGTVNSPPVSVKLNMHSDGRHVTLRRLTEEEAAAERARHSRNRSRRRRAESTSSLSGNEVPYPTDRFRRTPVNPNQQQYPQSILQNNPTGMGGVQYAPTASGVPMPIPPPPPIPYTEPRPTPPHGQSSAGSRATFEDSVTGGSTNYEDNRRRRRAERAAASREKAAKANRAEFS